MRNSHKMKNDYYHVIGAVPDVVSEERFNKVQDSRTNKNNEPVKQYRFTCDCSKIKTVNEKHLDDMVIYGLRECIFSPANCDVLLEKLNEYSSCASDSKMFGVSVEKNGVNGHLRQKGTYHATITDAFWYKTEDDRDRVMLVFLLEDETEFKSTIDGDWIEKYPFSKLISQAGIAYVEDFVGLKVKFDVRNTEGDSVTFSNIKKISLDE